MVLKKYKSIFGLGILGLLMSFYVIETDAKSNYVGRWQGGKWACEKPLEIGYLAVYGPSFWTDRVVFNEQQDALLLGAEGPFLVANQDGTRLTYSDPNGSGQTFDLVRCR